MPLHSLIPFHVLNAIRNNRPLYAFVNGKAGMGKTYRKSGVRLIPPVWTTLSPTEPATYIQNAQLNRRAPFHAIQTFPLPHPQTLLHDHNNYKTHLYTPIPSSSFPQSYLLTSIDPGIKNT
jgi:hypothetical protein